MDKITSISVHVTFTQQSMNHCDVNKNNIGWERQYIEQPHKGRNSKRNIPFNNYMIPRIHLSSWRGTRYLLGGMSTFGIHTITIDTLCRKLFQK